MAFIGAWLNRTYAPILQLQECRWSRADDGDSSIYHAPAIASIRVRVGTVARYACVSNRDTTTDAWPDHMHDLHASTRSRTRGVVRSGPVGQKKKTHPHREKEHKRQTCDPSSSSSRKQDRTREGKGKSVEVNTHAAMAHGANKSRAAV